MNSVIYIVTTFLLLVHGCTSPSRLTSWVNPEKSKTVVSKILVVGIVHDSLLDVRKNVEDFFVKGLQSMGYKAEASLETFGSHGLSHFDEESTYINLSSQGIDAVMTIALLNKKKETDFTDSHTNRNSSSYYFNRIVNYRNTRASPKDHLDPPPERIQLLWESTLFNLSTLTPLYWAQTQSFFPSSTKQNHETYSRIILNNLQKQKVLQMR